MDHTAFTQKFTKGKFQIIFVQRMVIIMFEALKTQKRKVILDTDIGPDCDDVGAIATLLSYAKDYNFEVIGICNCTSNMYGCGAVDAVCRYCGAENIPLGIYSKSGFYDSDRADCIKYNKYLSEHFSPAFIGGTLRVMPHVEFYRKLLSGCDDGEVMIISIGMFNNISDLLNSRGDEYSKLDGRELVARKVYSMVSMATVYPKGREFNVVCDYEAARNVFENFPKNIYLSDFHTGFDVITGFEPSDAETQFENPIFKAYELYTGKDKCKNSSYDLTAVQFACEGEGEMYSIGSAGRIEFYNADEKKFPEDATRFVYCEDGKIFIMKRNLPAQEIADSLNRRLWQYNKI